MKAKDGMQFTPGVRHAFAEAESVERVKEIAERVGIEMSDEEAENLFNMVGKKDLTDDEMDAVAGGCDCNYSSCFPVECDENQWWTCTESMH